MQNRSDFATRATRKTTRFGVRDAKCNAAGAMHRVAWALHESWRTRKKCGFFREKHDFSAEDKGFERLAVSKAFSSIYAPRDAKYDSRRFLSFETTRSTNYGAQTAALRRSDLQGPDYVSQRYTSTSWNVTVLLEVMKEMANTK